MPGRRPPLALIAALVLAASALAGAASPPAAATPAPPCERDAGTLTADATITGAWAETCQSAELGTTTAGDSMFHSFTLSARRMVTIGLASSAGDAELVLRKGNGRTGVALEEDDDGGTGTNARIRLPLDAATYTIEAKVEASATGAYTLTIGLVTPPVMTYPTFDTTCNIATAGSYSILTGEGEAARAVATYEELRTEATAVRLSFTDGGGVAHAAFYATVEAGDVFEWRTASDCWTRYIVTSATAPGSGATSREFGVKWVAYAYSGCSGVLPGTLAATMSWYPANVQSSAIASPVRHGAFHLAPRTWTGSVEPSVSYTPPSVAAYQAKHKTTEWPPPNVITTTKIAEAREFPGWQEPTLPENWTLHSAEMNTGAVPPDGYCAHYENDKGLPAVKVCVGFLMRRPLHYTALPGTQGVVRETRLIDGLTALVSYSPLGEAHDPAYPAWALIYDDATATQYFVVGYDSTLKGDQIEKTIAIARGLLDPPMPAPPVTGHGPAYGTPR